MYGSTLFLSAFLLFWIQPLLGKRLLPWFGGSPAVWTTCMLFFQVLLLAGYGYAHVLARRSHGTQTVLHALMLALSLATLPVLAATAWKPASASHPLLRILGLLAVGVGFPYVMLAATTPLLQSWFGRSRPGASPYRLYALSNAGSLLAILAFPFLIEPSIPLRSQTWIWAGAYGLFAALCGWCALGYVRVARTSVSEGTGPMRAPAEREPSVAQRTLWMLLPACSSLMLLSATNQLCLDVAAIPLLWVLPLGVYLLSFILCFHKPEWYVRPLFGILLAAGLAWSCDVLLDGVFAPLGRQLASASLTLFAACMVCHGELVRIKPGTRHLTAYYGMIAAGGAVGALFVTLVAPVVFKGYWEYPAALLAAGGVVVAVAYVERTRFAYRGTSVRAWILLCVPLAVLAVTLGSYLELAMTGNLEMVRSFYGVLRVFETNRGDPRLHRVTLMHGRVQHGFQYQSAFRRNWPTSYYGPASGIGLALRYHPKRAEGSKSLRIGVVGLGAGTLASYAQPGDTMRFYELNPDVVRLCRKYFSYLTGSAAQAAIVLGDARISMQQENARGEDWRFDVLAVDAFSGDAIPVHLLTRECAEVYRSHLQPDGILALHVSSRYFDLTPVARGLAHGIPWERAEASLVSGARRVDEGIEASDWVLLTANAQFLRTAAVRRAIRPWTEDDRPTELWTDDYSNLFHLLRRGASLF